MKSRNVHAVLGGNATDLLETGEDFSPMGIRDTRVYISPRKAPPRNIQST